MYRNSSMAYWGAHCCLVKVMDANFVEFFMNELKAFSFEILFRWSSRPYWLAALCDGGIPLVTES